MSELGRCCRKSRKLRSSQNLAKVRFLAASAAASLSRTRTKLCGRSLVIPCGPPTSARVRRAGGVEKFSSPVRKTFFDSIGQNEPFHSLCQLGRSTSISGPPGGGRRFRVGPIRDIRLKRIPLHFARQARHLNCVPCRLEWCQFVDTG
jgi:hypothetical protein